MFTASTCVVKYLLSKGLSPSEVNTFYYKPEPALTTVRPTAGPLTLPVTMNEMLLRGCMLKNSRYILGLVVYTGPESRIQMNAAKTPNKVGPCLCTMPICDPLPPCHLRHVCCSCELLVVLLQFMALGLGAGSARWLCVLTIM